MSLSTLSVESFTFLLTLPYHNMMVVVVVVLTITITVLSALLLYLYSLFSIWNAYSAKLTYLHILYKVQSCLHNLILCLLEEFGRNVPAFGLVNNQIAAFLHNVPARWSYGLHTLWWSGYLYILMWYCIIDWNTGDIFWKVSFVFNREAMWPNG